jgi:hypothetical protein
VACYTWQLDTKELNNTFGHMFRSRVMAFGISCESFSSETARASLMAPARAPYAMVARDPKWKQNRVPQVSDHRTTRTRFNPPFISCSCDLRLAVGNAQPLKWLLVNTMKGSSQTQRYGGRGHSHALHGDKTFSQPIIWKTTLAMIFLHAGAVAALFVFTWQALILTIALWWISGSLGVGMGYHRLLTHRGYKTPKWVE